MCTSGLRNPTLGERTRTRESKAKRRGELQDQGGRPVLGPSKAAASYLGAFAQRGGACIQYARFSFVFLLTTSLMGIVSAGKVHLENLRLAPIPALLYPFKGAGGRCGDNPTSSRVLMRGRGPAKHIMALHRQKKFKSSPGHGF